MEEENPTIRVAFVGDKRMGNRIVKFFKERSGKCSGGVTAVDFYVMSMKIKDFKDVNFNIIILKSFNPNDNDNFYKRKFDNVPAAVFVWDKTSKESYNKLRENLEGVNQLTNPFKAIVSANEGKQKDITETAELDRIAEDLKLQNYIVNYDGFSVLEKLFADIARKILNIPVTFEKINNQEEEYGYEFQEPEPDIKEIELNESENDGDKIKSNNGEKELKSDKGKSNQLEPIKGLKKIEEQKNVNGFSDNGNPSRSSAPLMMPNLYLSAPLRTSFPLRNEKASPTVEKEDEPKDFNGSSSHVNSSRSSGAKGTQGTPSPETQEQKEGKKCLDCCIII